MLCQTVSELMATVACDNCRDHNVDASVSAKCLILKQKLDALLATMNEEVATTFTTVSSSRNVTYIDSTRSKCAADESISLI